MDWVWDETDAGKPAVGGDIAKLFKHEEPKAPGDLAVGNPPAPATLMAREVIQNSWDAARELASDLGAGAPQFEVEFRFLELSGDERQEMIERLGLRALATRRASLGAAVTGFGDINCLLTIDDESPLRVLLIEERGATGMYGPWSQNKSHMYLALVSLGYTEKASGAGGSYGYGKAGLIAGSKIRSIVAYSCFRETPDDPGVTRRLLGMTYWGPHDFNGQNFTGFGSMSAGEDGRILPFVDIEADHIAEGLGIALRTSENPTELGTTFLVVDPLIDPSDLVVAIERSWWPALQENDFIAKVVDYDGSVMYPRPRRDELLKTFIDAWELATGMREPGQDDWRSDLSGPGGQGTVGVLALVSDLSGWSFAHQTAGVDDEGVDHRSLVALTRGPRMVVEYLELGRSAPFLRGVFIADEEMDDVLRRTEPKGHDSWQTRGQEGEVDFEAAKVASHVLDRIRQTYNNHRQRLKPAVPPPEDISLPFFNDIMRRVMSGMGKGVRQPVPETRPISIHLDQKPAVTGETIKLVGSAAFAFSDHFDGDRSEVELSIVYRFLEDDRVGEQAKLYFDAPDDFEEVDPGVFRGFLDREREVRIRFESEPYDPNWTGRLLVNGDPVRVPMTEVSAE